MRSRHHSTLIEVLRNHTIGWGSDGCWEWRGATTLGYGTIRFHDKMLKAHRAAYEEIIGPIPEGLVLDHLCGHRDCINPAHLEPVTMEENARRGHPSTRRAAPKTVDDLRLF